jgi:hypothetical protein
MIVDFLSTIEQQMSTIINQSHQVKPEDIGLDTRSAWRLYIDPEFEGIIVPNSHIRTMEYYGGFEYVGRSFVVNTGQYTLYLAEDDRVQGCIDRWREDHEETVDED